MAEELKPDICVIGGGPGGLAAARGAARRGLDVVLLEKGRLGGAYLGQDAHLCRGLATAAATREWLRRGIAAGVSGAPIQVSLARLREHIAARDEESAARVARERLEALDIKVVEAEGVFADERTLQAGETTIRASRFVIATGSSDIAPDIEGLDDPDDYLTPAKALDLGRKPGHILVLGAGARVLELAQAYTRIGIDATVIDSGEPLPGHDDEQVEVLLEALRGEGVRLRTRVPIRSFQKRRGGVRLVVGGVGDSEATDQIDGTHLMVVGSRRAQIEGLGLQAAKVAVTEAGIIVDGNLRTSNRRVYAVGDVVARGRKLGDSASQARLDAERALSAIMMPTRLPRDRRSAVISVGTDPALAAVGLGEEEAKDRGEDVRIHRYPFNGTAKAHMTGLPQGSVKVVTSAKGRILGVSILGQEADELITPWSLAIARGLPLEAMAGLSVATPSLSEAFVDLADGTVPADLTSTWRKRMIRLLGKFG